MKKIQLALILFLNLYFSLGAQEEVKLQKYQEEILKLVNAQRMKGCQCGASIYPPVHPLRWNKRLENAAEIQVKYLAKNSKLSHLGQEGSNVRARLDKANYIWKSYAENIAEGYDSSFEVFDAWIKSPGHCKNIMGNFIEMAVVKSGDYWVQDFASPKSEQ